MRRVLALVRKELWEHGGVLLALAVLLSSVWLFLLLANVAAPRSLTTLEVHAWFVRFFLTLTALALGRRLVVREYHGRTQLFLEALPMRRVELLFTKLGTGAFIVVSVGFLSLAMSAMIAGLREPVTLGWLLLIAGRTLVFALSTWCFFFLMGLLGRWRFAVYAAVIAGVWILDESTAFEVSRWGPIALVGETFVLEREVFPVHEALVSIGLAIGFVASGVALASIREGSVAEALSRKMSQREKVAVGMFVIVGLTIGSVAEEQADKEPFDFHEEAVVRRGPLAILYLDARHRPAAERLAAVVHGDLRLLQRSLRMRSIPRMHIALEETLEPDRLKWAPMEEDHDGALLHANFVADGFAREELRAWILEGALGQASDHRASFEENGWVRVGVARTIAHRGEPAPARIPALRALWLARQRSPDFSMLDRWELTEERFGTEATEGGAYAIAEHLQRRDRRRWLAFARETVALPPPWGLRAVIEARLEPVRERVERMTGASPDDLSAAWRAQIAAWRADPRLADIHRVPRAHPRITIERGEGDLRTIVWTVAFTPAPEPGSTCALLHQSIGPFDRPLGYDEPDREEYPCDVLREERLLGRYAPGERVFLAIAVRSPTLATEVRVHAERMVMP